MIKEKFIATTALHSFWDLKGQVIFLGPWCLLSKDEHIWQSLDYEIMPSPWKDRQAYYDAGKYTYNTYHYLLAILTDYLNDVLKTNHGVRFWQIIIGGWLYHFTEAFYDRYVCIRKALDSYSPFETILLDESNYLTPQNTIDFFDLYLSDYYNLQLYCQLFIQFGVDGIVKNEEWKVPPRITSKETSLKYLIKRELHLISKHIAAKRPIVLWNMYLSFPYIIKYVLCSRFKSFPVLFEDAPLPDFPVKHNEDRNNLASLQSRDEFSKMLINSLPTNFPTLYLEGFNDFLNRNISQFKSIPKIIMSANGWLFNENLKFLSAYCMEKGSILCGCQHGGLYGTAKWMPLEYHEIKITDYFFTWGWNNKNEKNVKSLPNPKISRLIHRGNKIKVNKNNKQLLFVGNTYPRYLYRFFSVPVSDLYKEYIEWRNIFLTNLSYGNQDKIIVRLCPTEYGGQERISIEKKFPEIKIDNYKLTFLEQLERTKIVIIDHPVTTMIESLSRNIPTMLYWNPLSWEMREEVQSFFEELASVNIWHKDPVSAAQFLNEISANPLKWWKEDQTQLVRTRFVNQFALADKKYGTKWWNEMQKIMSSRPELSLKKVLV